MDNRTIAREINAKVGMELERFWHAQLGNSTVQGYHRWISGSAARQGLRFDSEGLLRQWGDHGSQSLKKWYEGANGMLAWETDARLSALWDGSTPTPPVQYEAGLAAAAFGLGVSALDDSNPVNAHRIRRLLDLLVAHAPEMLWDPPSLIGQESAAEAVTLTLDAHPDVAEAAYQAGKAAMWAVAAATQAFVGVAMNKPDGPWPRAGAATDLAALAIMTATELAYGDALIPATSHRDLAAVISGFPSPMRLAWSGNERGFGTYLWFDELDTQRFGHCEAIVERFLRAITQLPAHAWNLVDDSAIGPITPFSPSVEGTALPIPGALDREARRLRRYVAYVAAGRTARDHAEGILRKHFGGGSAAEARGSWLSRWATKSAEYRENVERYKRRFVLSSGVGQAAAALTLSDAGEDWLTGYAPFAQVIPRSSLGTE